MPGGDWKFEIRCCLCGDQNQIDDDERSSIQIYFNKLAGVDHMIFCCTRCGNQEEHGVILSLDSAIPLSRRKEEKIK